MLRRVLRKLNVPKNRKNRSLWKLKKDKNIWIEHNTREEKIVHFKCALVVWAVLLGHTQKFKVRGQDRNTCCTRTKIEAVYKNSRKKVLRTILEEKI